MNKYSKEKHDDESNDNDYVDNEDISMVEKDASKNGSVVSVFNPYLNPTIEGHDWKITANLTMRWFKKYFPIETDLPYFRSKPPWSMEILPSINQHDIVLTELNMKKGTLQVTRYEEVH